MGNTRWQVTENNGRFQLSVRVDSDVRPGRELSWEGQIKVGSSGYPSLARMRLAGITGDGTGEWERPESREKTKRDLILDNTTNSGGIRKIIEKVMAKYGQDSQRLEELLAEQAVRESPERTRTSATTSDLRELASLGTQEAAGAK